MKQCRELDLQQFSVMQTKLISNSFLNTLLSEPQWCPLQSGIAQWLNYCAKLKPLRLSHRNKVRCVQFEWFCLDTKFKALHPHSLAILFNFTVGRQRPVQGLASCVVLLDSPALDETHLNSGSDWIENDPIFQTAAACLPVADSDVARHVIRIIPRSKDHLRAFQAFIESEPFSINGHVANNFSETLPEYLARQVVAGIGLDFAPERINRLLRGYDKADCFQNILVCHVSASASARASQLSDDEICTLKYRNPNHHRTFKK